MSLALNYEGEEKKLKGSAGSARVKGKGWWLWLGALRCWLWKGSFSHWDFHHVPTVGASQPRRKGSLQRSSEKGAEQADPCTGLDYGVIHQQVMLWETQPRDSSLTSAHGQPLPAPPHESQGMAFTLGIWLPKSGLARETFLGADTGLSWPQKRQRCTGGMSSSGHSF